MFLINHSFFLVLSFAFCDTNEIIIASSSLDVKKIGASACPYLFGMHLGMVFFCLPFHFFLLMFYFFK